jgi:light-independent protochlorophyllide reductase subunit N
VAEGRGRCLRRRPAAHFDARHRAGTSAPSGRWRATAQLAGKRIFFFPDSQLEIPLARFLSRELGMS